MLNIRRFQSLEQYQAYKNSGDYKEHALIKIGQATIYDNNTVVRYDLDWNDEPLRLSILSDGVVTWNLAGEGAVNGAGQTIMYSKNGGTWTNLTSTVEGSSVSVQAGDALQFKAAAGETTPDIPAFGPHSYTYTDEEEVEQTTSVSSRFGGTCNFNVSGNITSLLWNSMADWHGDDDTLTTGYVFASLFQDCTGLASTTFVV